MEIKDEEATVALNDMTAHKERTHRMLLAAREEAKRVRAWSDELKPPRDPAAEGAADEDE